MSYTRSYFIALSNITLCAAPTFLMVRAFCDYDMAAIYIVLIATLGAIAGPINLSMKKTKK